MKPEISFTIVSRVRFLNYETKKWFHLCFKKYLNSRIINENYQNRKNGKTK